VRWHPQRSDAGATQRLRPIALAWPLVAVAGEIALYYELPLQRDFKASTVLWLLLGIVALSAFSAVQIAQTARSPFPRFRAVMTIVTVVPIFLLLFAASYYLAERAQTGDFNEQLSRTDALYFTVTVFSTVGFGDIVPQAQSMRVLVMVQMIGDLILIGVLGRAVLSALGLGLERKQQEQVINAAVSPLADDEP
jgi:voltage-gated potassium channel